jgi:hypothetical protein
MAKADDGCYLRFDHRLLLVRCMAQAMDRYPDYDFAVEQASVSRGELLELTIVLLIALESCCPGRSLKVAARAEYTAIEKRGRGQWKRARLPEIGIILGALLMILGAGSAN